MEDYKNIIGQSPLFDGVSEEQVNQIMTSSHVKMEHVAKGNPIFLQGTKPDFLYVLLAGKVSVFKISSVGRQILMTELDHPGEIFGEIYFFMKKQEYQVQAEATQSSVVLKINKSFFEQTDKKYRDVLAQMQNNLMGIFSMKAYMLSNKVRILGCSSIREKIAVYLWEKQKGNERKVQVPGREAMAEYLNVTRPSLSRELGNMEKEGLILLKGKTIVILNQEAIENYL